MTQLSMSSPFKSRDKRTTYVTMSNGMRRRVEIVDGKAEIIYPESKAEKKAAKRLRQRSR